MRTLSARILLGFAALTITFGVITAMVVIWMSEVEDEVVLIGKGYVPLARFANDLDRRQEDLHAFLEQELPDESEPAAAVDAVRRIRALRNSRDHALDLARRVFDELDRTIEVDPNHFAKTRPLVGKIGKAVEALEAPYTGVFTAALGGRGPNVTQKQAAALATLVALREPEKQIRQYTKDLQYYANLYTEQITAQMIANERIVRMRAIYGGGTAVVLGLLVTIWVVITLRPLNRLRDGARRVAAGDYASRIPERGPAEVADLAREFNSMGHAVEERERELVRSERLAAVGKMAAMITHEVRNPLSSIGLNTELLEDELGGGDVVEARALCHAIHREVDRLTAITEEYLAFARLPKPKLAAEPINTIVGALAAFVREDLAAREVALATDLANGDPIAQVDAAQLRQCLINLVRNAADAVAAKGGGQVTLRTRAEPARVQIEVEDDGVGIAPDVLPRLFDPFFSTKEGGNGLGLALTQQIVRDHGGDLTVTSTRGRGTTFTLSVPTG
jgi:two-component system NtrC family sensor kinase